MMNWRMLGGWLGCIGPLVLLLSAVKSAAQTSHGPVVAIARGSILTLYDASGTAMQTIDLKLPVSGFALSPDRTKVVVVSADTVHGGALILIDLKTRQRQKLTNGHLAFKHLDPGETEVYDSPEFSPDGRSIVFGAHGNRIDDGNDAWENSGPLVVYDLGSGRAHVLKATDNIDGNGPCSESDPHWSADGKQIIFNCEEGAVLTDALGTHVELLKTEGGVMPDAVLSWVGKHCVLYEVIPEEKKGFDYSQTEFRILNLLTKKSVPAEFSVLVRGKINGYIEHRSPYAEIVFSDKDLLVATMKKTWVLPLNSTQQAPQTVSANVIGGWSSDLVPASCK